jgi:hypothetical protein
MFRQPGKHFRVCVPTLHLRFKGEIESPSTHPDKIARLSYDPNLTYATALRSAVRSGEPFVIQLFWGIVCG